MSKGTKTTLTLLAVLAIIVLAIILLENPFAKEEETESSQVLFTNFDKDKVAKIITKKLGTEINLEKVDGEWWVNTNKANQDFVNTLLDKVKGLKKGDVISQNSDKQGEFQVNEVLGLQVIIKDGNDNDLANFYIGKSGASWNSQYIRLEGSDEVILIKENLKTIFDKTEENWRDKTILSLDKNSIKGITSITAKEKVVLKKSEGKWQMISPVKSEVDSTKMDDILTNVSLLKASSFTTGKELVDIGLVSGKEKSKVVVKMNDDNEIILLVGNEENSNYYVKKDKEDTIYQVTKNTMDKILISSRDLKKTD